MRILVPLWTGWNGPISCNVYVCFRLASFGFLIMVTIRIVNQVHIKTSTRS